MLDDWRGCTFYRHMENYEKVFECFTFSALSLVVPRDWKHWLLLQGLRADVAWSTSIAQQLLPILINSMMLTL